jgi:uroporphyrinogen-III decarboxylase
LTVRLAQGEEAERTPVWFMRQGGCYMADFHKFLDNILFREMLEMAKIAIELD